MNIKIIPPKNSIKITEDNVSARVPVIGDIRKAYKLADAEGGSVKMVLMNAAYFLVQDIVLIDDKRLRLDQVDELDLPFLLELIMKLAPLLTPGSLDLLQSMSNTD